MDERAVRKKHANNEHTGSYEQEIIQIVRLHAPIIATRADRPIGRKPARACPAHLIEQRRYGRQPTAARSP